MSCNKKCLKGQLQFENLIKKGVLCKTDIINNLRCIVNTYCSLDIFFLCECRTKLLINFGKYIDFESNRTIFIRGLKNLHNKIDYFKKIWDTLEISIDEIPLSFRWFIINIVLCYISFLKSIRKNIYLLTESFNDCIKEIVAKDFSIEIIIKVITDLNANVHRIIYTSNKEVPGKRIFKKNNEVSFKNLKWSTSFYISHSL